MKKVILGFLVIGILVGGAFSSAQGQERKPAFSLNLGVQTNLWRETAFDNAWFTLDVRVGIPVGTFIAFSPEVMAVVDDSFDLAAVWLYPGVMLNVKLGKFFVGAGAVLPIVLYEGGSDSGKVAPKVNIGFSEGDFTLTAYIFSWTEEYVDFLDVNFIGATLGYRF